MPSSTSSQQGEGSDPERRTNRQVPDDKVEWVLVTAAVEARRLSRLSLRGLDLLVDEGEAVAVIGEAGAGKSVLLSCLLGLGKADAGTVRVLGRTINGEPAVLEGLGVAFQQPGLFDAWTVAENVERAAGRQLGKGELRTLLDEVGLDEVDPEGQPGVLSGGQRKRVALLRAMVRATRLLVLDEPTSGLDPQSTGLVAAALERWRRAGPGRTLLIVTHDYDFAVDVCDRFQLLTGGRLVAATPGAGLSPRTRADELRSALGAVPGAVAVDGAPSRPVAWGFRASVLEFLRAGLALSITAMGLLGALLVIQSPGVRFLDVSRYVPAAVTHVVLRELAPLVVGLLLAARIGARVAAEVAGMSYTAQLDSMRLLGLSPRRLLLGPYVAAAVVAFPVCIAAGAASALLAGSAAIAADLTRLTISANRFLFLSSSTLGEDGGRFIGACLAKGVAMGSCVAWLAYRCGDRRVDSASDLGRQVTAATLYASFGAVLCDILGSAIFFTGGAR